MVIKVDRRSGNYTEINNVILHDKNITLGAKAVFCVCVSEKQDGWDWSEKGVAARCGITRGTAAKYLQELEEYGYLHRVKLEQRGKFGKNQYRYDFYERPIVEEGAFVMPQNIHLTQAEYNSLIKDFGNDTAHTYIGFLAEIKNRDGENRFSGRTDFEVLHQKMEKDGCSRNGQR